MEHHPIIHIAGPSGSGKTTLGKKLSEIYKNAIVKDTDDLHKEFQLEISESSNYQSKTHSAYQKYIYDFIDKNKSKSIIFVGLVNSPTEILDMKADYKFYIDIPLDKNLKQKFFRAVDNMFYKKNELFEKYLKNPEIIQRRLEYFVNLEKWKEEINNDNKLYTLNNYIFARPEKILKIIKKILLATQHQYLKGGNNVSRFKQNGRKLMI